MSRRRIKGGQPRPPGQGKHRKARVLRFSHKHSDSSKAWGGRKQGVADVVKDDALEQLERESDAARRILRERQG